MMECQASESKKLFKTFDCSRRKKSRRKREGRDDSNSVPTDGSTSGGHLIAATTSAKSLHAPTPTNAADGAGKRERGSSSDVTRTQAGEQASPRRHKRHSRHHHRDATSLALKAGIVSPPRSDSPTQDANTTLEVPRDEDSFIYAFLEDAIKKDKKKHRERNSKKQEQRDCGDSPEHERSPSPEHVSRRPRRSDNSPSHTHRRKHKEEAPPTAVVDQKVLMKAFAKLCEQMSGNAKDEPVRTRSSKSLHCKEDVKGRDSRDPEKSQRSREHSRGTPPRNKSQDRHRNLARGNSTGKNPMYRERKEEIKPEQRYHHDLEKFSSKMNVPCSRRDLLEDRYPEELDIPAMASQTRSRLNTLSYCRDRPADYNYKDREYDDRRGGHYKEDGKRYCEQKTSRSFNTQRDPYMDEDRTYRRTSRSDTKDKHYEPDARYDDRERKYVDREQSDAYYDRPLEVREKFSTLGLRDKQRSKRNTDTRYGREDDYRDRYSERERDSGLSVADGETSTVSGRSTYFRVVKQEISEQREAMDKMMKLWKDLMKCFKGIQQPTDQNDKSVSQETAESARESAAAQLQLWRECMRRYETVARDVGDTDARLMDEINKQRSEMAEMATMWQECLQRYRDMSKDFNNLKEKMAVEAPRVLPPPATSEGERASASAYRMPSTYPHPPPPIPPYLAPEAGSPLRARASAPPPWQWWGEQPPPPPPRRRQSSPESRGSRERRHRHKDRDRDDTRYKEKSKSSAPRSDNRRRKR